MSAKIDWERIEAEYRAGQFSLREIARQHEISDTAIRKKAKEFGWKRDLSDKVREAVRIKTVRDAVRNDGDVRERSDEEIVELAAERGAQVLQRHQNLLGAGQDLCGRLLQRVQMAVDDIEGGEAPKTQVAKLQALAVAARTADLLDVLVRTASKVIPLERQAFNLSENADSASVGATFVVEE